MEDVPRPPIGTTFSFGEAPPKLSMPTTARFRVPDDVGFIDVPQVQHRDPVAGQPFSPP